MRIVEKAALNAKDPSSHRGVFDVVRGMVVCASLRSVAQVLRRVAECDAIELVRVKDRFLAEPSPGGWRDCMVCFVLKADDKARHVCELQIAHAQLLTARKGLPGHAVYNRARNASELLEVLRACRTTAFDTAWTRAFACNAWCWRPLLRGVCVCVRMRAADARRTGGRAPAKTQPRIQRQVGASWVV